MYIDEYREIEIIIDFVNDIELVFRVSVENVLQRLNNSEMVNTDDEKYSY